MCLILNNLILLCFDGICVIIFDVLVVSSIGMISVSVCVLSGEFFEVLKLLCIDLIIRCEFFEFVFGSDLSVCDIFVVSILFDGKWLCVLVYCLIEDCYVFSIWFVFFLFKFLISRGIIFFVLVIMFLVCVIWLLIVWLF